MNAPKLVLHALLAGLYGALLVVVLLLTIDPALVRGEGGGRALVILVALYTLASACLWPLLYGALRFFASHRLRVPWLSLRYLLAFHVANCAVILAAGWSTLSRYRRVLAPAAVDHLAFICLSLSLAWLCAAGVVLLPFLRRRQAPLVVAGSLALLGLLTVAARLAPPATQEPRVRVRPPLLPAPAGRLLLLNFDGAELDTILTLQAQGKLPAFSRLREQGVYGRLQSIVPCEAAVTRTTLVTGRRPFRHGVRSGLSRRLLGRGPALQVVPFGIGFDTLLRPVMATRPTSILDRSGQALWEIAAQAGGAAWAGGFEIDLDTEAPGGGAGRGDAAAAIQAGFVDPDAVRRAEPAVRASLHDLVAALEADRRIEPELESAARDSRPGIAAFSFPGLDRVAHMFLRYARPQDFGNVTAREVELYGEVLERYYRKIDALVGRAMAADGACLVVTSSHGMEPVPLRERIFGMAAGSEAPSGTHEAGSDGFLFVRGPGVGHGPLGGKGTLVDVVPTALYALGLPVARDLDGTILTAVFTPRYILEHPVAVIGSYEPEP